MMDIIKVPFGYLLDWLVTFTNSYGVSLILFSLLLKIILLPASAKSKKSSLKMARIAPQVKALEIECGEDKNRYQQEVSKLYKQEGVGCTGGCLWAFLPLLLLFPLYEVIRAPLQYIMHIDKATVTEIIAWFEEQGLLEGVNQFYRQMSLAGQVGDHLPALREAFPAVADKFRDMNFTFLGLPLGQVPGFKVWTFSKTWVEWGLFLVPIISAASQLLATFVSQLANNKVVTTEKGEQDTAAQSTANSTTHAMMLLMPVMSLYFGFTMPAAISVYWFAQSVFGVVQDWILGKMYSKLYAEEDAKRRELTAQLAAREAERERLRAERREKLGEEGMLDPNTSKKKLKQQEEAARREAAAAWAAAKNPQAPEEEASVETDKHFSGDPERPYCRGRAYKPTRYGRKADE